MLKVFFKITITVFENKIEFFITWNDLFKIDNVWMFEYFK